MAQQQPGRNYCACMPIRFKPFRAMTWVARIPASASPPKAASKWIRTVSGRQRLRATSNIRNCSLRIQLSMLATHMYIVGSEVAYAIRMVRCPFQGLTNLDVQGVSNQDAALSSRK